MITKEGNEVEVIDDENEPSGEIIDEKTGKIKNELEIKKYNLSLDIDKYRRLILTDEFSIKLKEESITKLKEEIKKIQNQISS